MELPKELPLRKSIEAFKAGVQAFPTGVNWLRRHPFYLFLLILPMLLGIAVVVGSLLMIFQHQEVIFESLLFEKPLEGIKWVSWWICYALLWSAMLIFSFLIGPLLADVLATPCYEIISARVEKDFFSSTPQPIKFWSSIKLIGEEFKKVLAMVTLALLAMPVPFLNVILPPFLVACDFYDYPLARRGFSFKQRVSFVLQDVWSVLGFGFWFTIPFIQFLIMPLAVAGGTILAAKRLEKVI